MNAFTEGDDDLHVSFWNTKLWKSFRSISTMKKAMFQMGALGHRARRPTTIATSYPRLHQFDGVHEPVDGCLPPTLMDSREMRSWSEDFKTLVAEAVVEYHDVKFADEQELMELDVKLSKLTKAQREEWKQHLLNDHQPYRPDCSVCINAQATGYKHSRCKHPALFTMSLDLAGPFKTRGRDMDRDDYKYVMVAAYRCPREYLSAMSIPEVDREMYVPSEEEDDDALFAPVEKDVDSSPPGEESDEKVAEDKATVPTLDEEVEELQKPVELATIYVTRPLTGRKSSEVLLATRDILFAVETDRFVCFCGSY